MYVQYLNTTCQICRELTNQVELLKWKKNNPNVPTSWNGSDVKAAKRLKDSGYFMWKYPIELCAVITADCHGDEVVFCRKHLKEWFDEMDKELYRE